MIYIHSFYLKFQLFDHIVLYACYLYTRLSIIKMRFSDHDMREKHTERDINYHSNSTEKISEICALITKGNCVFMFTKLLTFSLLGLCWLFTFIAIVPNLRFQCDFILCVMNFQIPGIMKDFGNRIL